MAELRDTMPVRPWRRPPAGMIKVVDRSPLNWLWITFNTMEEPVRADHLGRVVPALAAGACWLDPLTVELALRRGARFQDGTPFTAESLRQNFSEMGRWAAPHPPGTWLNLPPGTRLEVVDPYRVRLRLPARDGLAPAKMRVIHQGSPSFWEQLGFGYGTQGTGEGRW